MDAQGRVEGGRVIATAHFAVPYVQWGLKDPSMLFLTVSKSVDIEITAAGLVTWIRGAAASQPRDPVLAVEPSLTVR